MLAVPANFAVYDKFCIGKSQEFGYCSGSIELALSWPQVCMTVSLVHK
jgi:hypothetical protein